MLCIFDLSYPRKGVRCSVAVPPIQLKEADPITHDEFIVGYQSGRLGCSVNVLRVSLLVYSAGIREKRIVAKVIGWSAGLFGLAGLWLIGLFFLPFFWALLAGAVILAIFALVCLHRIGEGVLSVALTEPDFYRHLRTEHALGIVAIADGAVPKLQKVVPMRNPRQARRR